MILSLNKCYKIAFLKFTFNKRNRNFEKHACQNMVAMETSSQVDSNMSYQIVTR